MAELLPQPPEQVTTQAPSPGVSPGEIAQPYRELADTLDKAGLASENFAESAATQAGYKSVTTDAQGNMTVQPAPIIGPASQAFARAQVYSEVAQADGQVRRDMVGLRDKFPNDPEGFAEAAQAYKQSKTDALSSAAGPQVGLTLGKIIDQQSSYAYRSMLWQHEAQIKRNFDESTKAVIDQTEQDLQDTIKAGGINSPQVPAMVAKIHSVLQERHTNPISGEPIELTNARLDQLDRNVHAWNFAYNVNHTLKNPSAPYAPLINDAAQKYNLDAGMLTRQIGQESGFHPGVVSKAGAKGIAQFTDATAARYGVDVASAPSSINGAAHYMSDLKQMFGGNEGLALAGYNWGEGNVSAWLASGANPNAMPAETRNYVKAITGLPVENWIRGERPSPQGLASMPMPGGSQGGVANAVAMVQRMGEDQSVDPVQRQLNVEQGMAAIKTFRQDLVMSQYGAAAQQKQTDNVFENRVIADTAGQAPPQITDNQIKMAPGVSPESKMRMLEWRRRAGMPDPMGRVSQQTSIDLFRRMNLPENDPDRISSLDPIKQAYISGGLTRPDYDWLQKNFIDARTPQGERLAAIRGDFTKAVTPLIDKSNPLMGSIDQNGKLQSYAYERYVDQKVDEYRQAGKSPFDLFDPSKPDFLGKPEVLKPFQKTLQQSVQELSTRFGSAPASGAPPIAQRKPGESVSDYLARTGK